MAFFDKLGKTVSEAGQKTIAKTKEIADTSKLNSMISDEEKTINNLYYQMGKLYVSLHSSDCEAEFAEMVNAVLDAENKIAEYKKQIQDIKGIQRCKKCGAEIAKGAAFCSSCGAAMRIQVPVTADCVRCKSCGAPVEKGMCFCMECGAPMSQYIEEVSDDTDFFANEVPVFYDAEMVKENVKVCPVCGEKMAEDLAFCTGCGANLNIKDEPMEQVECARKCPNCGEKVAEGLAF